MATNRKPLAGDPETVTGPDQTFTPPSVAQPDAAVGQMPTIQPPPFTSPTHHQEDKHRRHWAKLRRAKRTG